MYLGDEAIIDLQAFSLEGRPIRKVRQSVSRLQKAGYRAEVHRVSELPAATAQEVELVLERGREGAPERGFSMAMDSIRGEHDTETLVVLARDESDPARPIRGVLHFVPCYGRSAMSLSFMRRDPETPNGLTEFLVVQAIELLRDRGLDEMSLNFAAFARWMHSPQRPIERAMGKADRARQSVLPDREPVPIQRQVFPALGAPLSRVSGRPGAAASEPGRHVGGGPVVEARAAALRGNGGQSHPGPSTLTSF